MAGAAVDLCNGELVREISAGLLTSDAQSSFGRGDVREAQFRCTTTQTQLDVGFSGQVWTLFHWGEVCAVIIFIDMTPMSHAQMSWGLQ